MVNVIFFLLKKESSKISISENKIFKDKKVEDLAVDFCQNADDWIDQGKIC